MSRAQLDNGLITGQYRLSLFRSSVKMDWIKPGIIDNHGEKLRAGKWVVPAQMSRAQLDNGSIMGQYWLSLFGLLVKMDWINYVHIYIRDYFL